MRRNKQIEQVTLLAGPVVAGLLFLSGAAFAEEENDYNLSGLLPPTPEQEAWREQHMLQVKKVKLNELGLKRVNEHRKKKGQKKI